MEYNGYHADIKYSDEDKLFIGEVIRLNDTLAFHGSSVEELTVPDSISAHTLEDKDKAISNFSVACQLDSAKERVRKSALIYFVGDVILRLKR